MINKDYKKFVLSAGNYDNLDFQNFDDTFNKELASTLNIDIDKIEYNHKVICKVPKYNMATSNFLVGCLFKIHGPECLNFSKKMLKYVVKTRQKGGKAEIGGAKSKKGERLPEILERDGLVELIYLVVRSGLEK